ncbi:MAG TPA: tRNA preQ1(34) S-adenosylmethionine ribosyltransferase-isomerase QueA [Candidatus Binataceae bacterium]|nr:tRNA preQ1(34) S-adenosylmethionine ribosyltransferase-isomerase QueA [Candidatus Binataceae bacterium]
MRLEELDYDLPQELIAQTPLENRAEARLLVVDRKHKTLEHSRFYKLPRILHEGDVLVLNNTRVLPARIFANKESGARVEMLFIRPANERPGAWLAMIRSHRPLKESSRLILESGDALRVAGYARPGRAIIERDSGLSIADILHAHGTLALPHYIHREVGLSDSDDYQTVYADREGAIAAPTAGLHFTDDLFKELAAIGVRRALVTLHIGPGTFAPVRTPAVESHSMEAEWYTIPEDTIAVIDHARRTGGRIIPVGTSGVRALESYAITGDKEGFTGLFIHPGFRFKLTDAMITNFHMPRTTVLALVMALAGRDTILAAYREAIRHRYRFLSYGDAMLII